MIQDLEELDERASVEPFAIGPGVESVVVELWAAGPTTSRWDRAVWGGGTWGVLAWQSVGCDVGEATYKWGASGEAGILSLASAGELDLSTIDPDRTLDPLNTASPFYGYVKPGSPVRIRGLAPGSAIAATGFIDEATYDLASGRGRIRAVDGLAYLAQAQVADGVTLPGTLRARVREIVRLAGLATLVPVEPEAPTDPDVDPPVAAHDGVSASAWELITRAQLDALWYVWVGPDGTLRFRSWGAFPDAPFAGIGCPPGDALPADEWLEGLSTISTTASADAIRNSVRAYSTGTTWAAAITDGASISRYGPRPYDVERVVPDRVTWAGRILADRSDAGLEVVVGELRPYTADELAALLATGPSIVRVRDDDHGDLIDLDLAYIGATVGVTPLGWRWALVTALSRVEWDDIAPEPPDPLPDPGRPYHTETRVYACTGDALLALTSGGAKYGAGASDSLPIGTWAGWSYRAALKFATVPWGTPGAAGEVRAVTSAKLNVRTSSQIRVGFGSNPKAECRRITGSWSEGSSSSPSSSNAVVYPGPPTTGSGRAMNSLPTSQSTEDDLECTAIVRSWAPAKAGGSGTPQYGIALLEAGSSGSYTTEIFPRENATSAARPELRVTVEVYDA